jgi:hypothetical protein
MLVHEGREYHDSMCVPFAVRHISAAVGCGVVATAPIRKGRAVFHEVDVVELRGSPQRPGRGHEGCF